MNAIQKSVSLRKVLVISLSFLTNTFNGLEF